MVPAHYRAALGFRSRQEVILELDGDTIRKTPVETALDDAIARVQALARKYDERLGPNRKCRRRLHRGATERGRARLIPTTDQNSQTSPG